MSGRRRRMPLPEAAISLVIIALLITMFVGWRDCSRQGGTYVRGMFWMECLR